MWLESLKSLTGKLFLTAFVIFPLASTGCATSRTAAVDRPFRFGSDTFAFPNELQWEYEYDDSGRWETRHRDPSPAYSHRCFPMVRAAREFFYHARFDPAQPRKGPESYERLVAEVVARNSRRFAPEDKKIVFPGFADLHEFSAAHPDLLKKKCGGWFHSYLQRGNWRVIFPYPSRHHAKTAQRLIEKLGRRELPIIHIATFPKLNHALVVYACEQQPDRVTFSTYDPNQPAAPLEIIFHTSSRSFEMPQTRYFPGGSINVYEVFSGLCY
jgi:hypothetical protein